jgi:hypothetical protein
MVRLKNENFGHIAVLWREKNQRAAHISSQLYCTLEPAGRAEGKPRCMESITGLVYDLIARCRFVSLMTKMFIVHLGKTARNFAVSLKIVVLRVAEALMLFAILVGNIHAAQTWEDSLARMPLNTQSGELNRTNCVQIMLDAFGSNEVVKALIFMPGATDEFYLFRRATAVLSNSSPSLLDAVSALTNQTFIQATFRSPFLLLHTTEDPIEPDNTVEDRRTADRLKQNARIAHMSCNDRDWDFLQPVLKRSLKISLRPWHYSPDSWHFYRHSFAAWNVDGLQALEIAALAGKSKFTLRRKEGIFKVDPRVRAAPKFDAHLR